MRCSESRVKTAGMVLAMINDAVMDAPNPRGIAMLGEIMDDYTVCRHPYVHDALTVGAAIDNLVEAYRRWRNLGIVE